MTGVMDEVAVDSDLARMKQIQNREASTLGSDWLIDLLILTLRTQKPF